MQSLLILQFLFSFIFIFTLKYSSPACKSILNSDKFENLLIKPEKFAFQIHFLFQYAFYSMKNY